MLDDAWLESEEGGKGLEEQKRGYSIQCQAYSSVAAHSVASRECCNTFFVWPTARLQSVPVLSQAKDQGGACAKEPSTVEFKRALCSVRLVPVPESALDSLTFFRGGSASTTS